MARNGSGTYNRAVAPYVAGTTITAATVNSEMEDIATALTESMARNGESPATANIPMGGFRLTNLGIAIANTDAAALGQVTDYALAKAGDTATGALGVIAGTAAAPGVFVSGNTNTGLFQPAADTLAVTVGGAEVARFGANGLDLASGPIRMQAGTALLPAITPTGDPDTGLYAPGADILAVSLGGVEVARWEGGRYQIAGSDGATLQRVAGASYALRLQSLAATGMNVEAVSPTEASFEPLLLGGSTVTLTTSGTTRVTVPASGAVDVVGPLAIDGKNVGIQQGTEQATTSGTQIDFTSIPAGVRRVTFLLNAVSAAGSSKSLRLRIGPSGGVETSGYLSGARDSSAVTDSFQLNQGPDWADSGTGSASGIVTLERDTGSGWFLMSSLYNPNIPRVHDAAGRKVITGDLSRARFYWADNTAFDGGFITPTWES
jgi:hypothetical protein